MLLKILFALALAFYSFVAPTGAQAQESDSYLPLIEENGEVIGCSTEDGFARLLAGEEISLIAPLCRPYTVTDSASFDGWWFFDHPEYDNVMPDDEFIAARKYTMDHEGETIRFVWPYPLDPSDYAVFEGMPSELAPPTEEELLEYSGNPEAADDVGILPTIENAVYI